MSGRSELLLEKILAQLRLLNSGGGVPGSGAGGGGAEGGAEGVDVSGDRSGAIAAEIQQLENREVALDNLNAADEQRLGLLRTLIEAQLELTRALGSGAEGEERNTAAIREAGAAAADATAKLQAHNEAVAEGERRYDAGGAAFETMKDNMLGLSQTGTLVAGALQSLGGGFAGMTASMMKSVVSGELFIAIGAKWIDSMVQFALETDKVLAGFRASTGAGQEFDAVITGMERSGFAYGVTMEDAAAAVTELRDTLTDFVYMSGQQQKALGVTVNALEKMGFSYSAQAGIMQTATQAMGMSMEEAETLLLDVASTARSLGIDFDELGQTFLENKDFLVRFGEDGQEVFEGLAVTAKALGTEMSTLVKAIDQFQSFDKAGIAVGRLNAILGGPFLNSMDMMNASFEDPLAGIEMLREAIDQAGLSIEDMEGAELMALAAPLGLSLTETKELLGDTNEELEIRRMREEDLAEQAAKTQSITDALSNSWKALYMNMEPIITNVFIPITKWLTKLATGIGELTETTGGLILFGGVMGAVLGAGIGLMMAFTTAIPVVGLMWAAATWPAVLGAIATGAAIGGGVGAGVGAIVASLGDGGGGAEPAEGAPARFAAGGVVRGTSVAMVGEHGPEMIEMPVGTRVTSAPATQQLTDAMSDLISKLDTLKVGPKSENIQIAVYIGQEKIDDIVVKGLNSPAARKAFSPFTNG